MLNNRVYYTIINSQKQRLEKNIKKELEIFDLKINMLNNRVYYAIINNQKQRLEKNMK